MQKLGCHFKDNLATVDPNFPFVEWDRYLEQSLLTLNILHGYCMNPSLSACTLLHGKFDFINPPLALPITKAVAHFKLDQRAQ